MDLWNIDLITACLQDICTYTAFAEIISELSRSRKTAGLGRSQTFGVVRTRKRTKFDYSAITRDRPLLYKLLLDFAKDHVSADIRWNAITVNDNYTCSRHKDKGNEGASLLVGFGNYIGGELMAEDADGVAIAHNINSRPLVMNFAESFHWVTPFEGDRYSLVFYRVAMAGLTLPAPSVRLLNGKLTFYRGEEPQLYDKSRPRNIKVTLSDIANAHQPILSMTTLRL